MMNRRSIVSQHSMMFGMVHPVMYPTLSHDLVLGAVGTAPAHVVLGEAPVRLFGWHAVGEPAVSGVGFTVVVFVYSVD